MASSDEQAAQCQPRQRPPERLPMETDARGQIDEDLVLELGHGIEEEVGDRRHGDADDGPEEEQHDVAPRPDDRSGVRRGGRCRRRRRGGRARRVGHVPLLRRCIRFRSCFLASHGRRTMGRALLRSRASLADAEETIVGGHLPPAAP